MILNRQRSVRVARQPLESFLRLLRRELDLRISDVTVCFVSDAEIARMNETFRRKKGPTDVLSFPMGTRGGPALRMHRRRSGVRRFYRSGESAEIHGGSYLGDVAISPSTALRNARKGGRTLLSELKVLMLHGVLHLLGYDHETDHGEMDRIERRLRQRLGLA